MSARAATLLSAAALAALAACGPTTEAVPNVDRDIRSGGHADQPSTIGDLIAFNREDGGPTGGALPINKYLWRASLLTLEFMPLAALDPFSGVIVTDWSSAGGIGDGEPVDERFKVTVYISSAVLEARSLRVAVHREMLDEKGVWRSAVVSETTPRRLEDSILTRARQIRVAELEAGGG